jgi:hypothetical protein
MVEIRSENYRPLINRRRSRKKQDGQAEAALLQLQQGGISALYVSLWLSSILTLALLG